MENTNENMKRIREINNLLNRPHLFDVEGGFEHLERRGITYILERTEGKELVDAHKIFLENPIIKGESINKIVYKDGTELPRNVAFIDSGCACEHDELGIKIYGSRYLGGVNHRRALEQLDLPTLLTYGPVFQGIDVSANCTLSCMRDGIFSSEDRREMIPKMRYRPDEIPLESQVEFLTKRILAFSGLILTDEEVANYHVIPTRG